MKSYRRKDTSAAKQVAQVFFVWLSLGAVAGVPTYCSEDSEGTLLTKKADPSGKDIERAVTEAEARAEAARAAVQY